MHVLFLFAFLSFAFELLILPHTQNRLLRCLPLIGMELFPLTGMVYAWIRRPDHFIWSWEDDLVLCLWIGAAVLVGWLLAQMVFHKTKKD